MKISKIADWVTIIAGTLTLLQNLIAYIGWLPRLDQAEKMPSQGVLALVWLGILSCWLFVFSAWYRIMIRQQGRARSKEGFAGFAITTNLVGLAFFTVIEILFVEAVLAGLTLIAGTFGLWYFGRYGQSVPSRTMKIGYHWTRQNPLAVLLLLTTVRRVSVAAGCAP